MIITSTSLLSIVNIGRNRWYRQNIIYQFGAPLTDMV